MTTNYINYNVEKIANLEVAQDMALNDYFLIQPQDFNTKAKILPLKNMVVTLDNCTFARQFKQYAADIETLSTLIFNSNDTDFESIVINENNINNGAVTTSKLANESVTAAKLANGSVTADKIVNGNITTIKLVNESVTTEKLANESVTEIKLADGSVTEDKLHNTIACVVNATSVKEDGNYWWVRKWSDGWCEQGFSSCTKNVSTAATTFKFKCQFKDDSVTVTCSTSFPNGAYTFAGQIDNISATGFIYTPPGEHPHKLRWYACGYYK